jgi:catechol 2,3-dioxygenase-like lactoylglutathione lyase family enzyme
MGAMDQRLDLLTLGVPDLDEARRFYLDGLGWTATLDVPGEVVFIQVGHGLLLAVWGAQDLAADVDGTPLSPAPAALALAQIVQTEDEVRGVLDGAAAAGGTILKPAQPAAFGGYHGYFADPFGFRWEIATNPGWHVSDDGVVTIVTVEQP